MTWWCMCSVFLTINSKRFLGLSCGQGLGKARVRLLFQ